MSKGHAQRIAENRKRKNAKMKVKTDMDIFREEFNQKEIDELNDDEFYVLESEDNEPLFSGQALPGSLIKAMAKAAAKQVSDDKT